MNRYIRNCGCYHDGPGHEWVRCVEHAHRDKVEKALEACFGKPVCPQGCGDARRPKCMWESSDCPRQDVMERWARLLSAACAFVPLTTEPGKRGENDG